MITLFSIEALALLGEWERVAEMGPVLDGVGRTGLARRVVDSRSIEALRGLMAAARGDATETVARFEAALAHADERGLRIESAEARRLFAIALERLGTDAERAAALHADAATRYREIGMERFAALCGD